MPKFSEIELEMMDSIAIELFVRKQSQYQHMQPYEQKQAVTQAYERAQIFITERRNFIEQGNLQSD